jgi:uncharacterized protein YqjF (DUF2071 family)
VSTGSHKHLTELERVAIRERPDGQPLMHQKWGKLLFMHWRIEEAELRPLIPEQLEIDTFDGSAWIGIIPFTMWDIRAFPPYLPAVPGLSSTHELNVRTYVHYNRVPGVWFFSLDCNSTAAVMAARAFYHLPYFNAHIDLEQHINTVDYALKRIDHPPGYFNGSWNIGETIPFSHPDSLEFFLTERYLLYSEYEGELFRARVYHEPYELYKAELTNFGSTLLEPKQIPQPKTQPILHYAEQVSVDIWMLETVVD